MTVAEALVPGREQAMTQLGDALKSVLGSVRRLRGRETHRPGELSHAQYSLLFGLGDRPELATGELAQSADLSPATVTQMLESLVAMGLVDRRRSDRDRRVVTCSLTARGREVIGERRSQFEARWAAALAGFSTAELEVASAVLAQLHSMFDEVDAEAQTRPELVVPLN